jgi:hypothetical protein
MQPAPHYLTSASSDAAFLQRIAAVLQAGGEPAQQMRQAVASILGMTKSTDEQQTGKDVLAFFQRSPLAGLELDLTRDTTPLRDIEL